MEKPESNGSSKPSLNTEREPITVPSSPAPCTLCHWFEKRLNNTLKEQIKHMEKYHLS